jgi:hypothetical protein
MTSFRIDCHHLSLTPNDPGMPTEWSQ